LKLWNQSLPKIVFHLELGPHKTEPVSIPIPAQPLSHFTPTVIKAIGDELAKLRGKNSASITIAGTR
jgi:hypothetical protein